MKAALFAALQKSPWLFVVMTFAALLLLSRPRGLRRADGLLLIGLYAVFCVVEIAQT